MEYSTINDDDQIHEMLLNCFRSRSMVNYNQFFHNLTISQYLDNKDIRLRNTLELYTFYNGNLFRYYHLHRDELIELDETQELKLIQLSIICLIRELCDDVISYDLLLEAFKPGPGPGPRLETDLELEKLMMSVSDNEILRIKLDPTQRKMYVLEHGMRNIVCDMAKLQMLTETEVITRDDVLGKLQAYRDDKMIPAIQSLNYDKSPDNNETTTVADPVDQLIQLNLQRINESLNIKSNHGLGLELGLGYVNEDNDDKINTRKRKVTG